MGTLLLALFLATLVWIVAVNQENPVEERTLPNVPIELVGLSDDMLIMGSVTDSVQVSVKAPRLTLAELTPSQIKVTANITDLPPGQFDVELTAATDERNVSIESIDPE